jgi:hypothetical protein
MHDHVGLSNEEIRNKAHAIEIGRYFPIRERFWLERVNVCRDRDAIFICGDGHIKSDSFRSLLENSHIAFKVMHRGIGLTQGDEWFDRALHYLREHPEVLNDDAIV